MKRTSSTIVALVAIAAAGLVAQDRPPTLPQPKFDTSTEVVLVDVSVVTSDGRPVEGLKAADFELSVSGRPRAIQNVQFISTAAGPATTAVARPPQYTSNEGASSGRLLLLAVDEAHLRFGDNRGLLNTAQRLLDTLAPGDLVGLARLPDGMGGVEFTTDRARVREALARVTGKKTSAGVEELRISEAWAFESNDSYTWGRVMERDCPTTLPPQERAICIQQMEGVARSIVSEASATASQSIRILEQLTEGLIPMRTPITVVLISEGFFVGRDRNDLTRFARLAAQARVTLHIVQPGQPMFPTTLKSPLPGATQRDEQLLAEGLEMIAAQTRGAFYQTNISSGATVFDRISRELSGYYLLAFEPTDADRTSRDRRIKVEVKRRGVTVRARSTYALSEASATAALEPEAQVRQLLSAPLPASGLPIRVATYAITNAEADKVRVIVSAEIGEPGNNEVVWPVGLLVYDKNGKVMHNSVTPTRLAPSSARRLSPRLLLNAVVVEPGEYTLRLAAATPDGRSGSVHHVIDARLKRASGVQVSDLVLMPTPTASDEAPRPAPSAIVDSDSLTTLLEITGDDLKRLEGARLNLDIAESESGPALMSGTADQESRDGGQRRAFAASVKLGLLPPGEYVVRATLSVPGSPDTRIVRPFTAVPGAKPAGATGAAAASNSGAAAAPPAPIASPLSRQAIAAAVPRFSPDDMLRQDVVNTFLDVLQQSHPVSAASAPIVAQARQGTFAVTSAAAAESDQPTLAFIRGLAALQKKDLTQATAAFQRSLKGASDFLGAALYLGAVHAASGREGDAIGAWQMALLGDGGERAYPVLVDALLRAGDAQGALDLLIEKPEAWTGEADRMRRTALAQAMLGQYGPAQRAMTEVLKQQPDDLDLLFIALQVMYHRHGQSPLTAEEKQLFGEYAERYSRNRGPQASLVASWRRAVSR